MKLFPYLICICCFSCFWLSHFSLLAQLTGRVVDEQGQAIEAANVLLRSLPDRALVKGQITDAGPDFWKKGWQSAQSGPGLPPIPHQAPK